MSTATGGAPPASPAPPNLPLEVSRELARQLNQAESAHNSHPLEELFIDVTLQLEIATVGTPNISRAGVFKTLDEFWTRARAIDVRFGSPHPLPDQPRQEEIQSAVDERNALQRLQRWLREVCPADAGVVRGARERLTVTPEPQGGAEPMSTAPTQLPTIELVPVNLMMLFRSLQQRRAVECLWARRTVTKADLYVATYEQALPTKSSARKRALGRLDGTVKRIGKKLTDEVASELHRVFAVREADGAWIFEEIISPSVPAPRAA